MPEPTEAAAAPLPFSAMSDAQLARVRLIASDVDDTITDAGKIPNAVLEALAALECVGVQVVLVTGRPAGWGQALASYLPGVHTVVAENGLVMFDRGGRRRDLGRTALDGRAALTESADRLRAAHGLTYTDDDPFRLFERTFERPTGLDAAALAAWTRSVDPDVELLASSIHLHVRRRGWDKADGLRAALLAMRPVVAQEEILVVGDSPNDGPLFRRFQAGSVGVRNVWPFLPELGDDRPRYVTDQASARGFQEVANRIIGLRRVV